MAELLVTPVKVGAGRSYPMRLRDRERPTGQGGQQPSRTYVYLDSYDGGAFIGRVPAVGTGHPDDAASKLESYDWVFTSSKDFDEVEVTALYKPQTLVMDPRLVLPPPIVQESGSLIEVDVRRFPGFATPQAELGGLSLAELYDADLGMIGEAAPVPYAGMSSYWVPTIQVQVTQFYVGQPASVFNFLGRRSSPPGYGGGNLWLVLTGSQTKPNKDNPIGARTLVYQYSALEWPSLFYG